MWCFSVCLVGSGVDLVLIFGVLGLGFDRFLILVCFLGGFVFSMYCLIEFPFMYGLRCKVLILV
jgi:hypothetical protein